MSTFSFAEDFGRATPSLRPQQAARQCAASWCKQSVDLQLSSYMSDEDEE